MGYILRSRSPGVEGERGEGSEGEEETSTSRWREEEEEEFSDKWSTGMLSGSVFWLLLLLTVNLSLEGENTIAWF